METKAIRSLLNNSCKLLKTNILVISLFGILGCQGGLSVNSETQGSGDAKVCSQDDPSACVEGVPVDGPVLQIENQIVI